MEQAVILAAGRGKRLRPITKNRSKAMLPILGKPMVVRVLEDLIINGLEDFIIVISPDDQDIIDYFDKGGFLDGRVQLVQQAQPLGTAHALHQAAPFIEGDFILTACDSLFPQKDIGRLITYWGDHRKLDGLLSLKEVDPTEVINFGIVELYGKSITRIVEKPSLNDAPSETASLPIYCFSPHILSYLSGVNPSPRGEYELQDAIQRMIDDGGNVDGLNISGRSNLTSAADLLAINMKYFYQDSVPLGVHTNEIGSRTTFIPPVRVESGAIIGENCTIGPNVFIEWDCFIGDQVTLRDAVVLRGASLATGLNIVSQLLW
ncbi:MAG: sugar phosphate nucleotidyltransferase [Anaerolineales bacterium]|jgi:dTDP-glucose pyrophosphorylase